METATAPETVATALTAYARYYEDLAPETVGRLDALATPDVRFKDPFNDFRGRDRLKALYTRMFDRLAAPRFIIKDQAVGGRASYLRWSFTFATKRGNRTWEIEGMSEVAFNPAGLVVAHIDHWDAAEQFYEELPGLGFVLRQVKRRMGD